jgi:hypothetical protein
VGQFAEQGDERGFAAAMLRRFETDISGDVAELEAIGVGEPKGAGFRSPFGQDDDGADGIAGVVEELVGVDGFGPGFDGLEVEELLTQTSVSAGEGVGVGGLTGFWPDC